MVATLIFLLNLVSVAVNWSGDARTAAIISAVASLWAVGIFSNYVNDRQAAPNYAVFLSLGSGIAAVVFIIIGAVS